MIVSMLTVVVVAAAPTWGERLAFSDEAAMTAGAVLAGNEDGAGFWYNPASLASAEDTRLDVSGSTYGVRARSIPSAIALRSGDEGFAIPVGGADVFSSPNVLSLARRVNERWVIGATVLITEQDTRSASSDASQTFLGVPARQRLDFEVARTVYHAGLAASFSPHPSLRLGAALYGFLERENASLEYALAVEDPGKTFLLFHERSTALRAGLTAIVGADWRVNDQWSLALTARSPRFAILGSATSSQFVASNAGLTIAGQPPDLPGPVLSPLRLAAGARFRPHGGPHHLSAEIEGFIPAGLPTEATFAFAARLGGTVKLSPTISFGAGAFVETSPSSVPGMVLDERLLSVGGTAGFQSLTVLALSDRKNPIVLSFTLALRYAADLGTVRERVLNVGGGVDPQGAVSRVGFHELVPYVGSSVRF